MSACLPGCLAAWLPGCLAACLAAWLPGCLAAWLASRSVCDQGTWLRLSPYQRSREQAASFCAPRQRAGTASQCDIAQANTRVRGTIFNKGGTLCTPTSVAGPGRSANPAWRRGSS